MIDFALTKDVDECAEEIIEEMLEEGVSKFKRFTNPLFAAKALLAWQSGAVVLFAVFGLYEGDFFSMGPSDHLELFGVAIDSWWKWSGLMTYCFFDMIMYEWSSEVIRPFIMNNIQDFKCKLIPQTRMNSYFIVSSFEICGYLRMIVNFHIIFTQIDFIVSMFLGNMLSLYYTTTIYLRGRKMKGDPVFVLLSNGYSPADAH